jgi:hypothetical protein
MFNFKYEIKTNDDGRPYVEIDTEQTDHPEHKFMAIEITRYLLHQLLKDNEKENLMDEDDVHEIVNTAQTLGFISDQMANLIRGQNNALNDLGLDIKDE